MTIKKRLFLSNILMILVPVAVTLLIAGCCMGGLWIFLTHGGGLGMEDGWGFYWYSHTAAEAAEDILEAESEEQPHLWDVLGQTLRASSIRLSVTDGNEIVYENGGAWEQDDTLLQAAEGLAADSMTVSDGDRMLSVSKLKSNGITYQICLYGTQTDEIGSGTKLILVITALLLLCAILAAVLGTNRFLIRFVFRKIEGPLTVLSDGVTAIGNGELDFRIHYQGEDEFAPVCAAFKEMAARLKKSVERTKKEEESRKELLAGISHDLRSPLTSIHAYVEGLLDGVAQTPEAQQKYLRTIKTKAEDIDHMVGQLFLFSKLDMEEYPVTLSPIRLDQFLSFFTSETQAEYLEKGLALSLDAPAPVTVTADAEQLRRVLANILENSVKYKNKDTGRLKITVEVTEGGGAISLADDGPGVPEEAPPRLFDVFYRTDPARKNPSGGSGLGLAIAAKLIRRMGGSISAANGPEEGLVITITLPKEGYDAKNTHH